MNTRARREEIREALRRLEREGRLNPKDVIEAAKDPASVLHDEFEWDSERQAELYLAATARSLIRSYVAEVVSRVTREVLECPIYVRDPSLPHKQEGYVAVSAIRVRTDGPRDLYREELGRIIALVDRMEALSVTVGFADDFAEIASAIKKLRVVWQRLKGEEEAA